MSNYLKLINYKKANSGFRFILILLYLLSLLSQPFIKIRKIQTTQF